MPFFVRVGVVSALAGDTKTPSPSKSVTDSIIFKFLMLRTLRPPVVGSADNQAGDAPIPTPLNEK
jgi:hypothetical protein